MRTSNPLEHKLTQLKLGRIREVHGQWVSHAEQHELGYAEFLEELLTEELLARNIRSTASSRSLAFRLPPPSTSSRSACIQNSSER